MHTSNLKTTSKYSFILSDRGLIVLHFYIIVFSNTIQISFDVCSYILGQ